MQKFHRNPLTVMRSHHLPLKNQARDTKNNQVECIMPLSTVTRKICRAQQQTSIAMAQSRRMHGMMASAEPLMVTARSVEPGSISLATWIDAPVDCNEMHTNRSTASLRREMLPPEAVSWRSRRSDRDGLVTLNVNIKTIMGCLRLIN